MRTWLCWFQIVPCQQTHAALIFPSRHSIVCFYISLLNTWFVKCRISIHSTALEHSSVSHSIITMEHLFSPCTRLHAILENQDRLEQFRGQHPELLQELSLDVSTEELLSATRAFSYADLYAMLINRTTIAWLTPHAAVVRKDGTALLFSNYLPYNFSFHADGKDAIALARSPEHLLEICNVVFRLLAVSVVHSVQFSSWSSLDGALINAATFAYFMEQCQSLKVLTLMNLEVDENQCRVLGDFSRPDLEIVLRLCTITSAGTSALAEILGRNEGPTQIDYCEIDNFVLADGLRGNSRLKILKPHFSSSHGVGNQEILALAGALKENKGLVDLDLGHGFRLDDETWEAVWDSLKTHPTLEVLNLCSRLVNAAPAPAVIKPRIQVLLDMLKVNMSIHTIHLHSCYNKHELFRESVIPYLETNRFRPRLLATQRTSPIPYRAKVLGRALLSARTDANRFWMLLSGNAEVAFPSTTATIAAAANLPDTPTTAAATSTAANVVAVATISPATAASSVVAPTSGQKRRICP
jgi:hypothetical protein